MENEIILRIGLFFLVIFVGMSKAYVWLLRRGKNEG